MLYELTAFYAISFPLGAAVWMVLRMTHPVLVVLTDLGPDAEEDVTLPLAA